MSERLKITVFDAGNRKRKLGFMYADKIGQMHGKCWEFVACQYPFHEPWYMRNPDPTETVTTVRFTVADCEETAPGSLGWVRQMALVTDAPLTDLMRLSGFHLPGETDREHAMRHNSYRWP
ncbi:hypothetical protein [Mesorhizobium sp. B2-8-3]|uniref:hypothetical protein n=1 Tax=Mesorhizobium sp. B2-8-3 TaxID=2589905 RepID=UPI0011282806|nr:hypothetical protein [Mesorhizobium sp. B2-8-3]TPJ33657.1 hypothetical protein FJ418_13590 [Mesorhizobium sp. B2-8-3]